MRGRGMFISRIVSKTASTPRNGCWFNLFVVVGTFSDPSSEIATLAKCFVMHGMHAWESELL